ncbi:Arginase/deacetylase [Periconia macrospinosa]|uniref:Arginase/deacetylase n=1 Tax=Periconia macrospinosa TaxID=97972 RepID=A0A2V1E896_9PLEO|nr:Arginase/deacetylase [Periconia macrospinosa]
MSLYTTANARANTGSANASSSSSPSVLSISRSRASSPALVRKSSTTSLRGDPRPPSRRSSLVPNMSSPTAAKMGSPLAQIPVEEKPPPPRACDIAEESFIKELALHEGMAGSANAGTIVIIHDQCYGHRFSRPKTTKSTLNTIMERPERILASVRGISAAYVLLGERHGDGANAPQLNQNPPERIPFKIRKTSRAIDLTSQVVTNVHGTKWMEEFKSLCETAEQKLASTGKELVRDPPSIPGQPPNPPFHPMDLYLCAESLNAIQGALGGVLDAVDSVFQGSTIENGVSRAFVCIRPPGHHCSAEWPSGFCWINNVHVGIEHAMANYGLTHAAIIDFDLHHGDGSQDITWERNKKVRAMHKNTPHWKKTSIGYFSLHDINSFPCEDGDDDKVQAASLCIDNAHGQSIWNIHLETWSTPEEFWRLYEDKYLVLLEKTRKYLKYHTNRLRTSPNHPAPKAAIFLSAGFDASEHETAGMQRHTVNVPTEFYARFTRDVVRLSEEMDTGVDGRVISVLEGGYSDRALTSGVLSHLSGLCDGQVWTEAKQPSGGLAFNMQQRLQALELNDRDVPMSPTPPESTLVTYDPNWWHISRLTELENLVTPPPYVAPKKVRTGPAAHFSSPTQSFTAKVVDPTKLHRNVSGRYTSGSPSSRAPTPPPPEVDWATATQALSKLLIPADRQTRSCRPEELAAPKIKKEEAPPAPTNTELHPSGRQLRGRKPTTTIADLPLATTEPPEPKRVTSRRVSIASSVGSSVAPERSVSRASSIVPPSRRSTTPAPPNGVQLKKSRTSTAAASRIPKNQPPMPAMPSRYQTKPTATAGKENETDMDQLTSGLKRITLKLAPKEEYEARRKQKEAAEKEEVEKKPKTTTTRKPAIPRAPKAAATKSAVPKKPVGRPPKAKPAAASAETVKSPTEPTNPVASETAPPLSSEAANPTASAAVPLAQPEPIAPSTSGAVLQTIDPPPRRLSTNPTSSPPPPTQEPSFPPSSAPKSTSPSVHPTINPSTGLIDMNITRDHLPKPQFLTSEPSILPLPTSPPREDTPPPPPPTVVMPQFVNYNPQTFNNAASSPALQPAGGPTSPPLQWLPPNSDSLVSLPPPPQQNGTVASMVAAVNSNQGGGAALKKPVYGIGAAAAATTSGVKRGELPVFGARDVIPFAGAKMGASALQQQERGGGGGGGVKEEEGKGKGKEGMSVWDVPDTPAR